MAREDFRFDLKKEVNRYHFDCDHCDYQTNSRRLADQHEESTGHPINERDIYEQH